VRVGASQGHLGAEADPSEGVDVVDPRELDELDRPPVAGPVASRPLTFEEWLRKGWYAGGALLASFLVLPALLGPGVGVGVALLTSTAVAWFQLGRRAPARAFTYQLALVAPTLLLVLLLS
jgi:hypothetical protein